MDVEMSMEKKMENTLHIILCSTVHLVMKIKNFQITLSFLQFWEFYQKLISGEWLFLFSMKNFVILNLVHLLTL